MAPQAPKKADLAVMVAEDPGGRFVTAAIFRSSPPFRREADVPETLRVVGARGVGDGESTTKGARR